MRRELWDSSYTFLYPQWDMTVSCGEWQMTHRDKWDHRDRGDQ